MKRDYYPAELEQLYNRYVALQVSQAKGYANLLKVVSNERAGGTSGLITAELGKSLTYLDQLLKEPEYPIREDVKQSVEDAVAGITDLLARK